MPVRSATRPADQAALFATPVSLASLDATERTCPICHEDYIEFSSSPTLDGLDQEWPVRVDCVAEQSGLKRCCGHIFGRRCLDKHIQSLAGWRNKCPICRDIWFGNPTANNAPTPEESQPTAQREPQVPNPLRRSSRIGRRNLPDPGMAERAGVSPRQRVHPWRSTSFMQRLLGVLEVEEGSDDVQITLEEVQQRLHALYLAMQSS